jgi:hypothetical protein
VDKYAFLVAIFGMISGTLIVWAIAWGVVEHSRHRRAGELPAGVSDDLAGLQDQVDQLRQQLGEAQERIDFTERLLTRGRDESRQET